MGPIYRNQFQTIKVLLFSYVSIELMDVKWNRKKQSEKMGIKIEMKNIWRMEYKQSSKHTHTHTERAGISSYIAED